MVADLKTGAALTSVNVNDGREGVCCTSGDGWPRPPMSPARACRAATQHRACHARDHQGANQPDSRAFDHETHWRMKKNMPPVTGRVDRFAA